MSEPITVTLGKVYLEKIYELIGVIEKFVTASKQGWEDVWDEALPEFAKGKSLYMSANYCEDESIGKIMVWMRDNNAPPENCMPTIFETGFIGDRQSFIREAIKTWDRKTHYDVLEELSKPFTPPVE